MYITIDGPDATGKTTTISRLVDALAIRGFEVLATKEPGSPHSECCVNIRKNVLSGLPQDPYTQLLLFMADRHEHLQQVVLPGIKSGKIVVSDRSAITGDVYAKASGISSKLISRAFAAIDLIVPDISFISTADLEWSFEQISSRMNLDAIEGQGKEFHQKVHDGFSKISKVQKFKDWNMLTLPKTNENSTDQMVEFIIQHIVEHRK